MVHRGCARFWRIRPFGANRAASLARRSSLYADTAPQPAPALICHNLPSAQFQSVPEQGFARLLHRAMPETGRRNQDFVLCRCSIGDFTVYIRAIDGVPHG